MDEKLLRVIDLMAQLLEAIKEVDDCLSCTVNKDYGYNGNAFERYSSRVQMYKDQGFSEIEKLDDCEIHYTVVDGVMVFCLEDKEEEA